MRLWGQKALTNAERQKLFRERRKKGLTSIKPGRTKEEIAALKTIAAAKKIKAEVDQVDLNRWSMFRRLNEAAEYIAGWYMDSENTWAGLGEAGRGNFMEHLKKAQICLSRLEREHPNARKHGPMIHLSKEAG